jgi:hypothetical protein
MFKKRNPPPLADGDGPEEKWELNSPTCTSAPGRTPPLSILKAFAEIEALMKRERLLLREREDMPE